MLFSGIKPKIILIFSILVLVLVFTLSRISYLFVRNIYLEQIHEHIGDISSVIAAGLDPKYLNLVGNEQQSMAAAFYTDELTHYKQQFNLDNAFIFDTDFELLVSTTAGISSNRLRLNRKEINELQPGMLTSSLPFKGEDGIWYLWAFHRLNDRYFLGIQESVDRLAKLDQLSRIFLLIGLLGFGMTILSGWLLAGTISKPIERLVKYSGQIGKGDFHTKPPDNVRGELAVLRDALTRMRNDLSGIHREREKLLAQVAHEIRNPLGGIELLTGLISEDVEPGSKNANYTRKILEEIAALKNQINAYLSFSRPVEARMEKVDINDLITKVKRDFKRRLEEKKIILEVGIVMPVVEFDPTHLRQILNNLVSNSIGILGEGGKIRMSSGHNNGTDYIKISDNGPGIAPENLDRIFEPFFTTSEAGTGLGLSICQKLCKENGAELFAENNEDQGCTFTIAKKRNGKIP